MKPVKFIGLILAIAASSALRTSTVYAAAPVSVNAQPKAQVEPDTATSAPAASDRNGGSVLLRFNMREGPGGKPFEAVMIVGNGQPGVVQSEVEATFVSGLCSKGATTVTYVGSDSCSQDGPRHGILTSSLLITATPTVQPNGTVFVKLQIAERHLDALVDAKSPLGTVQLPVVTESNYSGLITVRPDESTPINSLVPNGEHWEVTASVYPEVHAGAGAQ
ncbi:hypothetical protein QZM64_39925 [Burkholderia cepacia]|uniref:hypothetical protein n=1 Tax=Burkholderia cepacia complex TaxID=87882 RepID=UPI000D00BE3A|nr:MULTISPECIES: hypothetical protein [Burkholderia cepacia complex]MDN7445340.1 hypothetical protein [Burkholderia cepacia]